MFGTVLKRIYDAEVTAQPWPHIVVTQVFTDEVYDAILANLPAKYDMETFNAHRSFYWLIKNGSPLNDVALFWQVMRAELFDNLCACLEAKFGLRGGSIGAELIHDVPGYSIGPHTDTTDKAITGLFYLPDTAKYVDQGTILYQCDSPDPHGRGHRLSDAFRPVAVVPYAPNTALFFPRTDMSFHGVKRTPVERWILAFDVFR
jgi:hypothetical protein